ncbi:ANTAR domain-containing protein [Terracoccus sp. 273MFTsu3.1]|uniref:ANTAR domain-containing protein n=1 Tax=Terracoccus sp. 273MFTsu3.1 TaxID=1172188 RepID=UPI000382D780|nr:ANTAR domain-containing protein [Terracoccus sp. 273MFTsu3.1]
MSTSSAPGASRGRSEATIDRNVDRNVDRSPATSAGPGRSDGIDLAVAVDLVVLHRGLTAGEAHELLCRHAEATGRDLDDVASDVIDLGTSRLPR